MKISLLASVFTLVNTVLARSTLLPLQDTAVHDFLHGTPRGWHNIGRADPDTRIRLKVALHMPDHDLFEETLMAVSSPDHADYGKHLSAEQVKALVKPRDTSTNAVLSWLEDAMPTCNVKSDNEWIELVLTVADAEKLLKTSFSYFTRNDDKAGKKIIRTLQYSLPRNIAPLISMVQPTTRFPNLRPQKNSVFKTEYLGQLSAASTASSDVNAMPLSCNTTITPDCLRALYNVGNYTANPDVGSNFGVAGYLNQYAKYNDLDRFLNKYAKFAVSQNFTYELINGGLSTQNDFVDDDFEANLDIQYAAALGYKQKITYYSTGGRGLLVPDLDQPTQDDNNNEPYLEFLTYMLALPAENLPQTLTSSYGEDEQSIPESYARQVCDMFGQLGMRGVSVLFSSGDSGPGSACQTNDGKNTTRFLPSFPAACPYVTSVGGTNYILPEQAVSFSSGGFSDYFTRPSYQKNAVQHYLNYLGDQWAGLYNPLGRGFPDVAAQGRRFVIVEQDPSGVFLEYLIGGTSASSPAFAALVSLLNNQRLVEGKKPLGFLNPWFYSHANAKGGFTDIKDGRSTGCTGVDQYSGLPTPYVPGAGWNATKGWDASTGLGTPNFGMLLELMKTHR